MAISINDDSMSLEMGWEGHRVWNAADGRWEVSGWPAPLDRNRAITAMVLAERLAAGHGDDDPFVIGWHAELTR
jgi:hypothetical protein